MKNLKYNISKLVLTLVALTMVSCFADLDQSNPNSESLLSAEEAFEDPDSYIRFLAKLYAGLATTGQTGPSGNPDISGIDEGESQYIRGYWVMQELTTDEAVIAWNDKTIKDFHYQTWTSGDLFINATFSRLDFQVKNCNEFLRQTTDEKLQSRGLTSPEISEIQGYRAEARFLRALSYWHFLDMFGSVGLVTENDPTDFFLPEQASQQQLFDFIENELLAASESLPEVGTNEYPRADKGAAWMVLSKLYMNAEVYTGTPRYNDAITYLTKINTAGYMLHDNYEELFFADNNENGAQNEFIFSVAFDGIHTQTYGGTTFLTHAPVGGKMNDNPEVYGIDGGWAGIRTTSALVNKFQMDIDSREQFFTDGQSLEIDDIGSFTDGYAIEKWKNVNVNGEQGSDTNGTFTDIDFPMFRLADAYLMYAEAYLRGGGGNAADALKYVNDVRSRAFGGTSQNISSGALTLDFILDERARELHWEGHRRTDLIRFGKFTGGSYIWPWKGNVQGGAPTPSYRNLFPIPANAIAGNPKLQQNPGY
jgi:starch-binding outer membrane protein, SusD/RagB family